jgi:hypothetical protein
VLTLLGSSTEVEKGKPDTVRVGVDSSYLSCMDKWTRERSITLMIPLRRRKRCYVYLENK